MEAFINSFLLVFAGEMGDKTQLLALLLVARYKRPWVIMCGIFVATVLNHALASWVGGLVAAQFSPQVLKWSLAGIFFAFAVWILFPDKEEGLKAKAGYGVFITTVIAFFLAEMGDKTQLATVALGARFPAIWIVTLGTTVGMMASNGLAVFLGEKLLRRIPMKWIRVFASVLFAAFGVAILLSY